MPQQDLRILWNCWNIMINSECTNGESDGSKHYGGDCGLGGTSLRESFRFHVVSSPWVKMNQAKYES